MKISWTFSFSNKKSYQQKIGGKVEISIGCGKMLTEYSQIFKCVCPEGRQRIFAHLMIIAVSFAVRSTDYGKRDGISNFEMPSLFKMLILP